MASTRARWSVVLRRPSPYASAVTLEVLSREAGLHPELVLRLVRLGLVEPVGGTQQEPLFARDAAARLARAARLRRDVGIDYAGAVLATQLLARIEELESRLRRYETPVTRPNSRSASPYGGGGGGTSVQRPRASR
jgi:hypothetical protein